MEHEYLYINKNYLKKHTRLVVNIIFITNFMNKSTPAYFFKKPFGSNLNHQMLPKGRILIVRNN